MIVHVMELEDIKRNGLTMTPVFNDVVLDEIGTMVVPHDKKNITKEGYVVLDRLAGFLVANKNVVIKLNGHTDSKGEKLNNLDISQKMSDVCKDYLISKGVDEKNIIPRGYADRYLLNKCRT